jgi:translation initiation factor 2B subunit (eIF-2B alpha/beta/delta family)
MIDETVRQIEETETQSASTVAVKAANALRELADREYHSVQEFLRDVDRNSKTLYQANRSHAPLYTTQKRITERVREADPDSIEEAKAELLDAIDEVVTNVETSKADAGARASSLIEDGDVLLTHENSSTVMATLVDALESGTTFDLYVTESRPRFLGRQTARELAEYDGVDVTVIVDGAVGHYLSECDRVFLGMNCLIDDTIYNRIGTYPIVATAADKDVPVTVVASSAKFIGDGFIFENRYRPASDVMREPQNGFEVGNPGYDAVPTRLVGSVVTEDGIIEF